MHFWSALDRTKFPKITSKESQGGVERIAGRRGAAVPSPGGLGSHLRPVRAQVGVRLAGRPAVQGHGERGALSAAWRKVPLQDEHEYQPGELAAFTMVTTGAMTKRIDRLERDGLVTRRASESDGRGRVVVLTPAGRQLVDLALTEHMRNERRLLDQLTPEQAGQLESVLAAWLSRFEAPLLLVAR